MLSGDGEPVRGPAERLSARCRVGAGPAAAQEAWRVERKFSRYRDDSVLAWIHRNRGTEVSVDAETASLLDFAAQCFEISGGLFDVTSGVLRRVWKFDGSDRVPEPQDVDFLLGLIGFDKVELAIAHAAPAGGYGTRLWRFRQGVCRRSHIRHPRGGLAVRSS